MKSLSQKEMLYWGLGIAAAYYLFIRVDPATGQSGLTSIFANVGATAGAAPVNLITGAATGAVVAAGQAVGIPATNLTKCQQDIANGDSWNASFDCDAATYLKNFGPQTWFQ